MSSGLLFSNVVIWIFLDFFPNSKKGVLVQSQALLCLYALLLQLLEKKDLHHISELMRRTVTDSLLLKVIQKNPHFSRYMILSGLAKPYKILAKPEF